MTLFTFRLHKEETCFSDIYCFEKHREMESVCMWEGGEEVIACERLCKNGGTKEICSE